MQVRSTANDTDSHGLLKAISEFYFIFCYRILTKVFVLDNTISLVLLAKDTDLAAAAVAIDSFKQTVAVLKCDDEYNRFYESALLWCSKLGICPTIKKKKKKGLASHSERLCYGFLFD